MSFFRQIDAMSIFERNSSRIEGIEMSEARKMIKQYKMAREDLKQRLLLTPGDTFTEARLKRTLDEVDQTLSILKRRTGQISRESFDMTTEQGIEDSAKEVNFLENYYSGVTRPVPIDQIIDSTEPENLLFNQFESSIETYNQSLRNEFQSSITQALIQNKTWSQAVWDMEQVFNLSEWRLARIVRTELHGIYGNAKNNGFLTIKDKYIPDLMKTLYHPMDSRTGDDSEAMAAAKLIVPLDEPFRFKYKNQNYVFMAPPNRPNDRAILIPYRKKYGSI